MYDKEDPSFRVILEEDLGALLRIAKAAEIYFKAEGDIDDMKDHADRLEKALKYFEK